MSRTLQDAGFDNVSTNALTPFSPKPTRNSRTERHLSEKREILAMVDPARRRHYLGYPKDGGKIG
jgi:hypothetical protein